MKRMVVIFKFDVSRTLHTDNSLMWDSLSNFQNQELPFQYKTCAFQMPGFSQMFAFVTTVCASDGFSWKCKPPWTLRPVDTAKYPQHLTKNSVALVRTRTIPTERPPPVGEVSANFCG